MRTYESETCRITLLVHGPGGADLLIYDKQRPDRIPFHRVYEWDEKAHWQRDLDTLVGATGAKEVDHAA